MSNTEHFNATEIEKKWQQYWEENNTYKTHDQVEGKENFFALSEFSYPSGNLHVGHWYAFAVPDIFARFKRMEGHNVLYPTGFDAFGLPAENAAIKRGVDPKVWTWEHMDHMRKQLRSMGASFDWSREVVTADPAYYKWTQWMFNQFYKNDMVYRDITKVNWCEQDKTILANEQVVNGQCERCGNDVEQKDMPQWMLKITDFADDLVDDLDGLDWDHSIKQAQREWIGRKEGSLIPFTLRESEMNGVNTGPGDDAYKEGEPVIERHNVVVVIEHPEKEEFLCARWKQVDWQGFVTGGIEEGDTIEETALAEVREETGYQNPKIVKVHDQSSHDLFWHVVKKQNRQAHYRIVHIKLEDLERTEPSEEEQAIAEFVWVPRAEVNDFLKREDMKYPWRVVSSANQTFGEFKKDSSKRDIVKIILENKKGEIFVFKHKSGNFDVPGGGIDSDDMVQAALVELAEETPYKNFKFKRILNTYKVNYSRQGVDHHGSITGVVFSLIDEEHSSRSEEDLSLSPEESWMKPQEAFDVFEGDSRSFATKQLIKDYQSTINVFTTRADTLFGVTYVVLAPEHEMVHSLRSQIQNWDEVETYLKEVSKKSDLDRQQSTEKTGVQLKGVTAVNPANNEEVPVWIADYVLAHFGTGAVMAVPAHDERDCEFALKYDLPFKFVVLPSAGEPGKSRELQVSGEVSAIVAASVTEEGQKGINERWNKMYDVLTEIGEGYMPEGSRFSCSFEGKLINSPGYNTQTTKEALENITKAVGGEITKTYRLRDWGVSRQRYWGCPIPVVYDPEGKAHPVPDEHLPWVLPTDVDHTPDGTAPLERSEEFKKRTEEIFGAGWTPEVDTMDAFVDSTWYFYRYLDAQNTKEFASKEQLAKWMPVDMYFGGAEHTTMHLLYSRFWTKALHKLGMVKENEPYKRRLNRGLILGPDGSKMSKSKGNIIDPDEVVSHVGADTVRTYLAFIGPFNEPGSYPWDPNGVVGIRRFLDRVHRLKDKLSDSSNEDLHRELHKTIKKVSADISRLKLNTAISAMMVFVNHAEKSEISSADYQTLLQLVAPFAPHISEELWFETGNTESIHTSQWPAYDEALLVEDSISLAVQINGKVRAQIEVPSDATKELVEEIALAHPDIQKWTEGKDIKKFIYVPGRITSIVI